MRCVVDKGRFGDLYAAVLKKLDSNKVNLAVTDGKWVKYPKGSAPYKLVQSLDGCNTGWCTAGESTARSHLRDGDFYVYYSNDEFGNPKHPRVAIRMEGNRISEVRGIAANQNLDAEIAKADILKNKLKEFGTEGEKYQKRSEHMQRLTQIERKTQTSEDLSKEDLRFLYELDEKMNHANAINFCKKLGGELPTKEMLEALIGKKGQNIFSDNVNAYWWSSSEAP